MNYVLNLYLFAGPIPRECLLWLWSVELRAFHTNAMVGGGQGAGWGQHV